MTIDPSHPSGSTRRERMTGRVRNRRPRSGLKTCRLFGTARRVSRAVGMRAGAGELAAIDNQIFLADWLAFEPAFQNLPRARGIARLSGQR